LGGSTILTCLPEMMAVGGNHAPNRHERQTKPKGFTLMTNPIPNLTIPPVDPTARCIALGRAADTALRTYEAELTRTFGASASAYASYGSINRHPKHRRLCHLRDEMRAAWNAYESAYRALHLPREET
jgi:hypothetical protein